MYFCSESPLEPGQWGHSAHKYGLNSIFIIDLQFIFKCQGGQVVQQRVKLDLCTVTPMHTVLMQVIPWTVEAKKNPCNSSHSIIFIH